ncbi:MAG: hypothetical protein U0792_03395 [Gemmataceae bacterium]
MRPFGDGVHGLPRLVRDMARTLDKAKLIIEGEKDGGRSTSWKNSSRHCHT